MYFFAWGFQYAHNLNRAHTTDLDLQQICRGKRFLHCNIKQVLSTAEDQEPYTAILTMEAHTAINSEDSLSSIDPLVHSKVVCMLITKFVSVYKRAEQFQQWQVMKQQPNQTVKAFLTKVASMGAIGGYQCSTALLTMATGLTPKASNKIAECRQLQLLESQKESIDGTKSTMLDLLDLLNQEISTWKTLCIRVLLMTELKDRRTQGCQKRKLGNVEIVDKRVTENLIAPTQQHVTGV